jgi:hypothetical protein
MSDDVEELLEIHVMKYLVKNRPDVLYGCVCIEHAKRFKPEELEEVYIGWWPEENTLY